MRALLAVVAELRDDAKDVVQEVDDAIGSGHVPAIRPCRWAAVVVDSDRRFWVITQDGTAKPVIEPGWNYEKRLIARF